ncbi:MAG: kelch repeat-containing protein [Candidatus Lernaella stagnicola]|nr:kelch repeat-containing protein [Candidatus Lernaella stagnicola]
MRVLATVAMILIVTAFPVVAAEGGPDDFGYVWTDAAPYQWIDAGAGELVTFPSEDSLVGPFPIGFAFDFYGEKFEQFYISSNGRLVFVNQQETFKIPCIPSESPYLAYIAAYWDDFDPTVEGEAYFLVLGEEPQRFLIVEFRAFRHWNTEDDTVTAQVILSEETSYILLQYQDPSTEAGAGATIGLMSPVEELGLSISCRQAGLVPASSYLIRHPAFLDLRATDSFVAAAPGDSSSFELSVRNATDGPATITFDLAGSMWPISITPPAVDLDPGDTGLITVQVDVPGDVDLWDVDAVTFAAVATDDPLTETALTLTTYAGPDWQLLEGVLPVAFQDHAVVSDGEWIYVLSNYLAPGVSGDFVRFNLAGDFEVLTPLEPAVHVSDGVYLWNKLVFLGGIDEYGDVTDAMNVWDIAAGEWIEQYRLPAPTTWAATVVLDQELYVLGGFDGQKTKDTVWVFNPVNATWRRAASLLEPRQRPLAGVVQGKIIVAGGSNSLPLRTAEMYDPQSNTWTEISPPPRDLVGSADCTCNDRFYAIGGQQADRASNVVVEYDPATDAWTSISRLQAGRYYLEADLLDGRIVVAGGMEALFIPTDSAETLDLDCADEIVPGDRDFGTGDDDDDSTPDDLGGDDDDDDEEGCCGC